MKLEDERKETPFAVRDNMLNIRTHLTELCYRGFGKKPRKQPKEPKNFSQWSEESKERWRTAQIANIHRQEQLDMIFIEDETKWIHNTCREIIGLIDSANKIEPQIILECDERRIMQTKAIGLCSNLNRELNFIMHTIPSNANFIVKQEKEIDREIALLVGWRKSCNAERDAVMLKEEAKRRKISEQLYKIK